MAATKSTAKTSQRDRHLTPVILTASGTLVAGKRRIEKFQRESDAKIVARELHHYAMLPFLRVARDEEGHLHITTTTTADENGWEVVT